MESNDLAADLMDRLRGDEDLDGIMSNEILQRNGLYEGDHDEDANEPDDIIIVHMDIREELLTLQKLVEQKIGIDLTGYTFSLQDAHELEPHKNLVDQCVKGEGLVQINVQIQTINQRINIIDVLKPTEAALAALSVEDEESQSVGNPFTKDVDVSDVDAQGKPVEDKENSNNVDNESSNASNKDKSRPCTNWVRDHKFRKEQLRLKIPEDPLLWEVPHVKHWFQWAVREFNLVGFQQSDWCMTGKALCALTHEEFRKIMPTDPGNVFYTHLQLLKECKFVSVMHTTLENLCSSSTDEKEDQNKLPYMSVDEQKIMRKSHYQKTKLQPPLPPVEDVSPTNSITSNIGSGNNGQIQLWQFLLELLTDREHASIIQWVGRDGEFRLTDPERVARLWGIKKNKPAMNYEKLSRALRYYYDGDMISKVPGKRFAYKFDCDLKLLIGYDAAELSSLVNVKGFIDDYDVDITHYDDNE